MNEFIFNGLPSSTFGAYVASSNFLDGASRDIQSVEIPGRSGNVILDNGRYNNFTMVVNVYIPENITQNAQHLKAFLSSHSAKYCIYEESFAPDVYRMARFTGEFTVETFDHQGGAFTLEFDCMPQRFLKSGTVTQTVTGSGTVMNPTAFESAPLLTVYSAGSIGINGQTIQIRDDGLGSVKLSDSFTIVGETIKEVAITDLFNEGDYITFGEGQVTVTIRPQYPVDTASVTFSDELAPSTYSLETSAGGAVVNLTFPIPKNEWAVPSSAGVRAVQFTVGMTFLNSTYGTIVGSVTERIAPGEYVRVNGYITAIRGTYRSYSISTTINGISGVSTVGGSYPFMIDLESVKAYKEMNGTEVSLNHLIEMDALDIPSLQPGENEITVNTSPSTQLDIVPRWWSV